MLGDLRQKIQGVENLEIALESALTVEPARQRKGPRGGVLGMVNDLSISANFEHALQTEGTADDVADQPLDRGLL